MLKKLFFNYEDYKLEHFQLENLSTSQVPFAFYGLDVPSENFSKSSNLSKYLLVCEDPFEDIQKKQLNKESPLVFICQNGKKSQKAVKKVVAEGFTNVYFVDGGFDSLDL